MCRKAEKKSENNCKKRRKVKNSERNCKTSYRKSKKSLKKVQEK